jgi:hypothetical protein
MPDIKRTFTMKDLIDGPLRGASNTPLKAGKQPVGIREAVGQVRRDRRRTKEQSEKLIREFLYSQTEPVVFLDIMDHLERRESPILRRIIEEMVASGEVEQTQDFGAGPLIPRYLYQAKR